MGATTSSGAMAMPAPTLMASCPRWLKVVPTPRPCFQRVTNWSSIVRVSRIQ